MKSKGSVGVIVGRFQVPQLHKGHRYLIDHVVARCEKLVVVLGASRGFPTKKNPLTFEMRKLMITSLYPDAIVVPLRDTRSDARWSEELDASIAASLSSPVEDFTITFYGSRASFIDVYNGKHTTELVPQYGSVNGTNHRTRLAEMADSVKFREGVIHREMHRAPLTYPTVDVAILREDHTEVLLGGKDVDCGKLRFIGGFVDPNDASYEAAARREVSEETKGLGITELAYIGSAKIDDWRYRGAEDVVMTNFYRTNYMFGVIRPGDDLDRLVWVPLKDLLDHLVPEHQALGTMLLTNLNRI